MKKIAYIELDTHAEVAMQFYNSMKNSENYVVDYYFSEKIMNQLGFKLNANIFLTDENLIFNQLKLKGYDFVLVGTVHRYFKIFYKIAQFFPMGFIAHNRYFTDLGKRQLFKNIFKEDVLYRVKLLLKEGLFLLPKIRKTAQRIFVLDKALADSELDYLPLYYCQSIDNQLFINDDVPLKVVISGTVSQQRRDYKRVLEELKKVTQKTKIFFLGKAVGEELNWLREFEKVKPLHVEMVYFQEKVSPPIYDDIMQQADVLWAPIQMKTNFFSQAEIYGKTKMTGALGDAIKYGKPILFPKGFCENYPFQFIENDLPIDKQFTAIKSKKINFHKHYSKEKVCQELENVFMNCCNK